MTGSGDVLTGDQRGLAEVLYEFHRMGHALEPADLGVVLGSHDPGVAERAAEVYREGLVPRLVVTGGNSPTTRAAFPRGEAVHYRERLLDLGVPDEAVLLEPHAAHTGDNIDLSRDLAEEAGLYPETVLLVSKPYMERRAYATACLRWPGPRFRCTSQQLPFGPYAKSVGDERSVVDMLVGDLQRLLEYPARGFCTEQEVPDRVREAYTRLRADGFEGHLIAS